MTAFSFPILSHPLTVVHLDTEERECCSKRASSERIGSQSRRCIQWILVGEVRIVPVLWSDVGCTHCFYEEGKDPTVHPYHPTSRAAVSISPVYDNSIVPKGCSLPKSKEAREDYWNCGAIISYYYDATFCSFLSYLSSAPARAIMSATDTSFSYDSQLTLA